MSDSAMDETIAPDQQFEPEVSHPVPAVGAQLAAEREAKGLSIEQVAAQLNLAPRQIQALELDNYAALPGMASVRGFVRAYAKLLKLDATPLIAIISPEAVVAQGESLIPRRALSSTPFSDNRSLSSRRRGWPSKVMAATLGLFVVLAVVFVGEQMGWLPGTPLTTTLKGLGALPAAEPTASPVAGTVQDHEASATVNADPIAVAPAPIETKSAPLPVTNAPAAEEAPAATSGAKLTPAIDGLVLKLREDSWVEIKRANNSVLISRLVRAGSTESFELAGPLALTLGNASGVDASMRGVPVDLKPGTKNNIARLNLK